MKTISIISHWPETNTCVLFAAFTDENAAFDCVNFITKNNAGCDDSNFYIDSVEVDPDPEKWSGILEDV